MNFQPPDPICCYCVEACGGCCYEARESMTSTASSVSMDELLAEAVAKHIFEMGTEYGQPCHRIEFKVMLDGREVGCGGLAREPFKKYVRAALASVRK